MEGNTVPELERHMMQEPLTQTAYRGSRSGSLFVGADYRWSFVRVALPL